MTRHHQRRSTFYLLAVTDFSYHVASPQGLKAAHAVAVAQTKSPTRFPPRLVAYSPQIPCQHHRKRSTANTFRKAPLLGDPALNL